MHLRRAGMGKITSKIFFGLDNNEKQTKNKETNELQSLSFIKSPSTPIILPFSTLKRENQTKMERYMNRS